jgi:metallo-beta-lactamase family protein
MESTYGNRDHKSLTDTLAEFEEIIGEVSKKWRQNPGTHFCNRAGTATAIPSCRKCFIRRKYNHFLFIIDSPMALEAIKVYRENFNLLDEEFQELRKSGAFPVDTRYFRTSATAKESQALNGMTGPMIILAGAGMCNGGRILHHLAHNIGSPETYVLIVGFQSYGSLGRRLVEKQNQ